MADELPLAPKQLEFILNSTRHWNIAHGSVRSGKTVGSLFRFMQAVYHCPDSQIFMVGHSSDTIYQNAIRLILESDQLAIFRPFCVWYAGKRQLKFMDKSIQTLGAKDEGAIGNFQGKTFSLVYCDEMTLYPDSIIDMIDTRLSKKHSMGFATMNPSYPTHKIKKWIDLAKAGDPNYYALHFTLDDNPYVDEDYKARIRNSTSGIFYKRNYLGLWVLAEGSIFDFFDRNLHVLDRPPCAAEYWIAGIDYGSVNPFACILVGVSTGRYTQTGKKMWVEREYFWDPSPKGKGRQKVNHEFAEDVAEFLEPYNVKHIYIDPSAEPFQLELRRRGLHAVHANNDVENGIQIMTSEMQRGNLSVLKSCPNTIREIESYVWDSKAAEKGWEEPIKKDDHCIVGDTLVKTGIGDVKIIDLIDEIKGLTYGFDSQKGFILTPIAWVKKTREKQKIFKLTLENGKTLRATGDHKVYTRIGYIEIQNLLPTDEVLCYEGVYSKVKSVEEDGIEDVYCLNVPETGNFVANGIVISNCLDALRYAMATHKVSTYQPYKNDNDNGFGGPKNKYDPTSRFIR